MASAGVVNIRRDVDDKFYRYRHVFPLPSERRTDNSQLLTECLFSKPK